MDNSFFQVNIGSIEKNYIQMNKTFDELLSMYKRYREMIEDTVNICDTATAKKYRQFVERYLDYRIGSIEKDFRSRVETLPDIVKIYKEDENIIKKSISGEKK